MSITVCFTPSQLLGTAAWRAVATAFFATLGVYTLHRVLSYRKIERRTPLLRYNLVSDQYGLSAATGLASLVMATVLVFPTIEFTWPAVIFALPPTVFYLLPPFPGRKKVT